MAMQDSQSFKKALDDLRQRAKVNYERDIEAIDRVERLLTMPGGLTSSSAEILLAAATNSMNGNGGTPDPNHDGQTTLIESVENMFRRFPERSWNVSALETQLRTDGFIFEAKSPKASINTSLARLTERGVVRVTKRGTGRKPSVYRAASTPNIDGRSVPEA